MNRAVVLTILPYLPITARTLGSLTGLSPLSRIESVSKADDIRNLRVAAVLRTPDESFDDFFWKHSTVRGFEDAMRILIEAS